MQELYNLPEPENCNIRVVTRNKDNQRIKATESFYAICRRDKCTGVLVD